MRLESPQTTTQSYGPIAPAGQDAVQWEFRGDNQGTTTISITLRDSGGAVIATDNAAVEVLN